MPPRILIAEDDAQYARWLGLYVESIWPDSSPVVRPRSDLATQPLGEAPDDYDLLLLCADFADGQGSLSEGTQLLRGLRRSRPRLPVVAVASGGNELSAVRAVRLGAVDYLPRDLLNGQLLKHRLRSALRRSRRRLRRLNARLAQQPDCKTVRIEHPPRPAAATPLPLPGFTLMQKLGDSASAEVWLAHSAALDRDVALKISKNEQNEGDGAMFAREYEAIAALDHPGVVDIYDYGVHEHREYLAMEYFPCGDLKRRLQQPLTPLQALAYLRKVTEALVPVHQAGMMHLDLKPANIMLRADDSVVLIDFGLVKHLGTAAKSTLLGVRRGSPYYMSPEQVQGLTLDPRSDVYSLGVVLFEMLTGRRPFLGKTAIDLMDSHVRAQRPSLPEELSAFEPLLDLMMTKSPDDRPANANALLALLLQFDDETTSVKPAPLRASA